MLKGPLKLLLLAALAAGAANIPGITGEKLEAARSPAGFGAAGSSAENAAEPAALPNITAQMAAMEAAYKKEIAGLPAEEREIALDAMPKVEFKANPLMQRLARAPGPDSAGGMSGAQNALRTFSEFRYKMFKFCRRHEAAITVYLWLVPVGLAGLAFSLFLFKRYTMSISVTGAIFLLSNYLLWTLSSSVVLSAALTKENLLAAIPRDFWLSPVIFLIVSAALLRLADENYPFWNRTIAALFTPITAACLTLGWWRGVQFLKSALAHLSS
ncbi:MAG: hypothetical protein KKH28_02190 [Elusimicrobia bacterium]|nr:hypothetical protein [Elusimicrobiota bacterium]